MQVVSDIAQEQTTVRHLRRLMCHRADTSCASLCWLENRVIPLKLEALNTKTSDKRWHISHCCVPAGGSKNYAIQSRNNKKVPFQRWVVLQRLQ